MALQDISRAYSFLNCYVQRVSATFGINSSPTTVEMTLIPGDPNEPGDVAGTWAGGAPNITGYNFSLGQPGRLSGFEIGEFKFAGILQSYEFNYADNGRSYSVRMADPRFLLENTEIVLDSQKNFSETFLTTSGLRNYLNIYHYYDSPQKARADENGVPFKSIRDYLTSYGNAFISVSGQNFQLQFDNSFLDFSVINFSGIPNWYRIKDSSITVSNLIQKVASDFNKDWYAYVDYETYVNDPNGLQLLKIAGIERQQADPSELDNYLANLEADGTLKSYKRGKELRDVPTSLVLMGPPELQWKGVASGDLEHFWGYDDLYGIPLRTDLNSNSGIVLLDHLQGSILSGITSTVNIVGTSYIKKPRSDSYPPSIITSGVDIDVLGYYPSYNTLEAALFSQDTWETVLYLEHPTFASEIGIPSNRFKTYAEYTGQVNTYLAAGVSSGILGNALGTAQLKTGTGFDDRTDRQESLISVVYQATQDVANNHYGMTWIAHITPTERTNAVDLPTTGWIGSNLFPEIDYSFVQEGWLDPSGSYPYKLPNMYNLHTSNNSNFKNRDGRISAFLSIEPSSFLNINTNSNRSTTGSPDLSLLDKNLIVQFEDEVGDDKLILPITIETNRLDPHDVIISLRQPIQTYFLNVTGFERQKTYNEFLTYMQYQDITEKEFLKQSETNVNYGFFPPRMLYPHDDLSGFLGFAVPIQNNYKTYGPFMKIAPISIGTKVIEDSSLTPWTYGTTEKMTEAAFEYLDQNITQAFTVDSAQVVKAGLPDLNIGDKLTESSTITALSFQLGSDGVTTNYTLRTFALPPFKINKNLVEKTALAFVKDFKEKQTINLDLIPNKPIGQNLSFSQLGQIIGKSSNSSNFIGSNINPSGKQSNGI